MDATNRGRALVVGAALMWSLGGVLTKEIPLPGGALAVYRSLIAGLFLVPLALLRGRAAPPAGAPGTALAPSGGRALPLGLVPVALVFGLMVGVYLESTKRTTAANAIFLQNSAIFWTIPLSRLFLGEVVDRRSVAGIAVALVGIALIVAWGTAGQPGEGLGIALGLASGVAYAGIIIGLRRFRHLDPTWLAGVVNLGAALALGTCLALVPGGLPLPRAADWPLLLVFGVVQMGIPYVLFARGLQTVRAPEAALLALIEPALNPVWVVLRHGEAPAPATLVGGAFLLLGVAVRYAPLGGSGRDDRAEDAEDRPQLDQEVAPRVEL